MVLEDTSSGADLGEGEVQRSPTAAIAARLISVGLLVGAATLEPATAQTVSAVQDLSCAGDRASTTCTAGEFTTIVTLQKGPGAPDTCIAGQTVTLDAIVSLSGTNADRFDVGFFVGQQGNDPRNGGAGNICSVATFPNAGPPAPPWFDGDGDVCGDYRAAGVTSPTIQNIKIKCQAAANGELRVPYVLTYQQNTAGVCAGPTNVSNGSPAKCNAATATVETLVVQGPLRIVMQTTPDGSAQSFGFTASGPVTPSVTSFSLVDGGEQEVTAPLSSGSTVITVTEDPLPAGWTLAGISCTDLNGAALPAGVVTIDTANRSVTTNFTPANPGAICTYSNGQAPALSAAKVLSGHVDADGSGTVSVGDTLSYTVTATNTGSVTLTGVVVTDPRLSPGTTTCASLAPGASCVLAGTSAVSQADADAGQIVNTGTADADQTAPVTATLTTAVPQSAVLSAVDDTATTTAGSAVTTSVLDNDLLEIGPATISDHTSGANGTVTCTTTACTYVPNPGFVGTDSYTYTITDANGNSATATVTVTVGGLPSLSLLKSVGKHEARVGDLIRYTLDVVNSGEVDAAGIEVLDVPPPGLSLVAGSVRVVDRDGESTVLGDDPLRVGGIDVGPGDKATVTYLLRVGAGIGPGAHVNEAVAMLAGGVASNRATATVFIESDALVEQTRVLGSVFEDRDGDGWQDPADATEVTARGGFAAGAYVPGSTRVARQGFATAEPGTGASLLRGLTLGRIAGWEGSGAARGERIVVSQRLSRPELDDSFVLESSEGTHIEMDAAGDQRRADRGDVARGLSAQWLEVERQLWVEAEGLRLDYVIENTGLAESGIPGVRLGTVEGVLVETDVFGRFHLEGIDIENALRGRNFIMKADPSTLPRGAKFTTPNPRIRRITQGLPVRFDFGVQVPGRTVTAGGWAAVMTIADSAFDTGESGLPPRNEPLLEAISTTVRASGGGRVRLLAPIAEQAMGLRRAVALHESLRSRLPPELSAALQVEVAVAKDGPPSAGVDASLYLGAALFDPSSGQVRSEYEALIGEVAQQIVDGLPPTIRIAAARPAEDAAGAALAAAVARAEAVFSQVAAKLPPEAAARLSVQAAAWAKRGEEDGR